jgi:hypothetical protein
MEVTAPTEQEAYGILFSKYPTLFAADNTFESLLNSLRDAATAMKTFGTPGTPDKLLYAANLTPWIEGLRARLEAEGITPVRNNFLAADGVVLIIEGPDNGSVVADGDAWKLTYTNDTWRTGVRIADVYSGGTVAWEDGGFY